MFILVFIITILILVVIHELGHFFVAKWGDVKVLEFGFGLPPRAWGKKVGETLVSINWLPFGGFVRLLGEDEVNKEILDNKRSFAAQSVRKRAAIVVAGVLMNLVLAWLLFYVVIIWGGFRIILPSPTTIVSIEKVAENSPAQQVGIKEGDRVLAVSGEYTDDLEKFRALIKNNVGKEITLDISDWDKKNQRRISITPRENPPPDQGAIGVVMSPYHIRKFETPTERLFAGPIYSYEVMKVSVPAFGTLFRDLISGNFTKASQQVAGPIGVAAITKSIVDEGIQAAISYIYFSGLLSLNLAVINILPFPGLDGGRLFFLVVEGITRKRAHPTLEKYVHTVGLVLLLSLIVLITLSDIRKLFFNNF